MQKKYPAIGCCGIDCGLSPRFYTAGSSRCPGCGGECFDALHPSCGTKKCCINKHEAEACGECAEYPCKKYENTKFNRDSFVTHKKVFQNHSYIKTHGIDRFISEQSKRISVLQDLLADYDDGRNKSFYCLPAALLSPTQTKAGMIEVAKLNDKKEKAKTLKIVLQRYDELECVDLSLDK